MFFIVNKTKGTIVIADIGVTLGPRQAIDLDKMMSRVKSEASKMLKTASKKGHVDIRIKDGGKVSNTKPPEQIGGDLDDFKKEMLEEMKGLLSEQNKPVPQGVGKEDLAEFAQQIINSIPKSETVIIHGQSEDIRSDEDVEMDEEVLAKINARTVEGIVKDVKLENVKHKEHTEVSNLEQNISELENLLG